MSKKAKARAQARANQTSVDQPKQQSTSNAIHPTSIFTLFNKEKHIVNWYVHRDAGIRKQLKSLWGNQPSDKKDIGSMDVDQYIVTRINALFRAMEKEGPAPKLDGLTVKFDSKHGTCNRVKVGCISKGFYHAHVSDKTRSYEVLWECFEDKKLINIVSMGERGNFDFANTKHDPEKGMRRAMEGAQKANFDPVEGFDAETYNNAIFSENKNKI